MYVQWPTKESDKVDKYSFHFPTPFSYSCWPSQLIAIHSCRRNGHPVDGDGDENGTGHTLTQDEADDNL